MDQNFTNYLDTVSREPILFGDYRNALTEDPRLYEDVVDYEAAKAIFDEVGDEFMLLNFLLVERSRTFHFNQWTKVGWGLSTHTLSSLFFFFFILQWFGECV